MRTFPLFQPQQSAHNRIQADTLADVRVRVHAYNNAPTRKLMQTFANKCIWTCANTHSIQVSYSLDISPVMQTLPNTFFPNLILISLFYYKGMFKGVRIQEVNQSQMVTWLCRCIYQKENMKWDTLQTENTWMLWIQVSHYMYLNIHSCRHNPLLVQIKLLWYELHLIDTFESVWISLTWAMSLIFQANAFIIVSYPWASDGSTEIKDRLQASKLVTGVYSSILPDR